MLLFLLALGFLFLGALVSLISWRHPAWARIFAPVTAILGSLLAVPPVLSALLGKEIPLLELPWSLPFGSLTMSLDPLSALFALPILVVSALAALYGIGYFSPIPKRGNLSLYWFNFSTLVVSMLVVITARNGLLFLLAWELMSLSSFFLVLFEKDDAMVRRAGWTYLIATHIGTAFLLVFFLLLGARSGGTLDFGAFTGNALLPGTAGVAFLLAMVGFGTKAGFMPLHVWLPEAHPAAPSNVSALMSGVMIKTGIYGLVRSLTFLGTPAPWWGWVLLAVGAFSGVLGVLFALAQHDLKRLLAYHSVENIGIIALGIGLGVFGLSCHNPLLIYLGFAGGLFHVVNHALFKSLLFLGAGSVLHSAGTREIDILGGLLKRMPTTGTTFLIGSVAICGLPPLNGFASEFMIYLASLGSLSMKGGASTAGFLVIGSLALIGGLAVACFTKAFGVIFLGEPRSEEAEGAHETGKLMGFPLLVLAGFCGILGLTGPLVLKALAPVIAVVAGSGREALPFPYEGAAALWKITGASLAGALLLALLLFIRSRLMAGRNVTAAPTWDCGYIAPTAKMQYTASSFADPITRLFRPLLRTRKRFTPPSGLFPSSSSFSTETSDLSRDWLFEPMFGSIERFLSRFRRIQHGRLNLYILCILLTLVALLLWKLR